MEEQNNHDKFDGNFSKLPPPPVPPSSGQFQQPPYMGQYQPQYNPPQMKTGNKNLGCIIGAAAVIVILILVIIFGILYITGKKDTNKEVTTQEKTTQQQNSVPDDKAKNEGVRLYFCEDYDVANSEEIGVSNTFTPGWLTVMLDMRDAGRTIGCKKVYLDIYKITDEEENNITPVKMKRIEFTVSANYDYIFFKDTDKLKFKTPGKYRVSLLDTQINIIAENTVKIVSKH
jgi:hypothetical protein